MSNIPGWLGEYHKVINRELDKLYTEKYTVYKAVRYAVNSPGKRIRPILSLLGCEVVGGKRGDAVPVALAYELLHNASLIQDDIIDRSKERRGRDAVHMKYGANVAILASDILLIDVLRVIQPYKERNFLVERLYEILECFNNSVRETVLGEALELEYDRIDCPLEKYWEIVRLKTKPLISTALKMGAIAGGGSSEEINALENFGSNIGVTWQIKDDILDVFGDVEKTGKPIFNDLKEKNRNLVFIETYHKADPEEREFLSGLWGNQNISEEEIHKSRGIIDKYRVMKGVTSVVQEYQKKAIESLNLLPDSIAKHRLEEINRFVIKRMA